MEAYFSNISERIIDTLSLAQREILVAVAWITDAKIINMLAEKSSQGVKVEILISSRTFDKTYKEKQETLSKFIYINKFSIFKIGNEDIEYSPLMHHKFCVVDNHILITGSFNWTTNASRNFEDIVIIDNFNISKKYIERFEELKSKISKKRLWFNNLNFFWQEIFKKAINIKGDPKESELKKIELLSELNIGAIPKSHREDLEEESFNELIKNDDNIDELDIQIYKRIAHLEYEVAKDLKPLSFLKNLRILNCSGTDIQSLEPLKDLTLLESLDISIIESAILDISWLKNLKNLKRINLGCTKIKNWEFISNLKNLEEIFFTSTYFIKNSDITTLEPLRGLNKLMHLDINGLQVTSFEPLNALTELETLYAIETQATDLSPLYNLKKLKLVFLNESKVTEIEINKLAENNLYFKKNQG